MSGSTNLRATQPWISASMRHVFCGKGGLWPLILMALAFSAGCIPVQFSYFKGSIAPRSDMKCHVSLDVLACNLDNQVGFAVVSPSLDRFDPAGSTVEVPVGHVAKLAGATATFYSADSSENWVSHILSREGFRYKESESSEKIQDSPSADITRELVGSTWNTHRFSEKLNGLYRFDISSDRPLPKTFQLQLPDLIVDGKEVVVPRISFQYGKWMTIKGIGGS